MKKGYRNKRAILGLFLFLGMSIGQESYIAQKLMVENNIRSRIKDALSKIVDEYKYVINVDVELEISDEVNEQFTMQQPKTNGVPKAESTSPYQTTTQVTEPTKSKNKSGGGGMYSIGLPIPGFEIEMADGKKKTFETNSHEPVKETIVVVPENSASNQSQAFQKTDIIKSRKRPSRAEVNRVDISLILQEGAAPELIENIRQLTMAAANFNRNRGDKLTIMTASFKERRDQRSAETILLKNIAEKIELLENKRVVDTDSREESWREELQRYRDEETARITSVEDLLKSEIDQLKIEARERAFQEEKNAMLKNDSLKLKKLNDEIQALKDMQYSAQDKESVKQSSVDSVKYSNLDTKLKSLQGMLLSAMMKDSLAAKKIAEEKIAKELAIKEKEKASRDSLIEEKLAMLEATQTELDQIQTEIENAGPDMKTILLALVSGVAVLLLVVLLMNKSKQPPAPPWMYPPPPRRKPKRKKKKKSSEKSKKDEKDEKDEKEVVEEKKPSEPEVIAEASEPAPEPTPEIEPHQSPKSIDDDPSVLQSEVNDIRKSVISMSVGQPDKTTQIVKDWMEAPAPPVPEPEAPAPEPESGDDDNSDKKKKK